MAFQNVVILFKSVRNKDRSTMNIITQANTGTMVKCVPQEQMFVIEATLLENHFLPSSGFVMLMSVEDVLIS